MTMTETILRIGAYLLGYLLFLWLLTWPLRHAAWLHSMRWEMARRQAFSWQSRFGGRS